MILPQIDKKCCFLLVSPASPLRIIKVKAIKRLCYSFYMLFHSYPLSSSSLDDSLLSVAIFEKFSDIFNLELNV